MRFSRSNAGTSKKLLRAAARAVAERLEQRRLLNGIVIAPTQVPYDGSGPLAPQPGKTFWINGTGGTDPSQYDSAITPSSTNDLILNVTPFATNYVACCDATNAAPGNTSDLNSARLLTNGLTQNQIGNFPSSGQTPATGSGGISDASSGASVVADASASWYAEYNLGAWPGSSPAATGYDISEIDVISGSQDAHSGMQADIQIQFVNGNTTDWFTLSNSHNFSFTSDPSASGNPALAAGSAQMAIVNSFGGPLAEQVRSIKFVAVNQQSWFRELVVAGTPSQGAFTISVINVSVDSALPGAVDVTFPLPTGPPPPSPGFAFAIQRATVTNGVTGPFATVGRLVNPPDPAKYVDLPPSGGTYVYRVNYLVTGSTSASVTTPPAVAEAHFYNQAFWTGPVVAGGGVGLAGIDSPTGAWPGTGTTQDSAVLTGKVTTNQSGVYTFISNTDDDGYLYVNGVLVSKDPGGHALRNAGQTTDVNGTLQGTFVPILLAANTSYDFVLLEHHASDTAAGAHLLWVTPSNSSTVTVPASNLSPVSDPPLAPIALTPVTVNSNFVNFTFNADNRGVVHYLLQRKDVSAGVTNQPWVTVAQDFPASNTVALNNAGVITSTTPAHITIQDAMPIAGSTYIYRVAAVNYDGAIFSPETPVTVATIPDLASPPTPGTTLTSIADAAGLSASGYFLKYTWINNSYLLDGRNRGETAGSMEQTIVLPAAADIRVTIPPAPPGAVNANVYISTAPNVERIVGSVSGGQTLSINTLPTTAARAVPTTDTAGLAPGTYFVAYTWLGDNVNATGETQDAAIDNASGSTISDETSIVLTGPGDLLISNFGAPPNFAQNVNVHVGTASGQENLVGTIAPNATLTLNTLSTPTNIPLPSSNTTAALSTATSPVAIPPQTSNPSGVEIHMYNGRLTDLQLGTQYQAAMNGIPAEYVAQSGNQSYSIFLPGLIDRDYNFFASPQPLITQTPDFSLFPDIPRVEWEDFSQIYTGSLGVGVSGVYTIISNTDDSGFVWINGALVSADPGAHAQRDTTWTRPGDTLVPVMLVPGQSYDLTMNMTLKAQDGNSGSHLKWIEPAVNAGNVSSASNNFMGFQEPAVTLNSSTLPGYSLVGFTLFITAGTGNGQQAIIVGWDSTNHTGLVNVVTNGNNTLWGTVPDSTSQYSIAWEEPIPGVGSLDNNNPTPGAAANGFVMRQDTPVQSTFDPNTGAVGVTSSGSAAGNLAITNIDPRAGITLTWTDQSNSELWFEVQRSTDDSNWTTLGDTPFKVGTTFTDTTAGNAFGNPAISYFYRVRGVNFDGAGPFTSAIGLVNGVLVAPPTISSIVQGAPGTAGLIFAAAQPSAIDTGGLDVQYAPVSAGATGTFVDATPIALPFNMFDYQITGLSASQQYVFKARYLAGLNDSNPNLFGNAVPFIPSGGVVESFGAPGMSVAGFASAGDLKLNGNAMLSGPGIPPVPSPASAPGAGAVSDMTNPTTPLGSTVLAGVPQPSVPAVITTAINNLALSNAASFFLEYTWLTSGGAQTLPSLPQEVDNPGGGGVQITFQVPSPAPSVAANANVFIGTSTANSNELLVGTVAPGATLRMVSFPATNSAHPPTVSSTGLLPGTYFVEYTFLNSDNQETAPSPEQTLTLANPSNDLILGLPSFPNFSLNFTVSSANVYLGSASGAERLVTNVTTSGGTVMINALPSSVQTPPTVSNVGLPVGTYYVGYSWQSAEPNSQTLGSGESQISPLNTVVLGGQGADVALIVPPSPAGAGAANIYVSNAASQLPIRVGTVGARTALAEFLLRSFPPSGAVPPPAAPTASAGVSISATSPGLSPGTYYLKYTWTSGTGYETAASPEQVVTINGSGSSDLLASAGASPVGGGPARFYLGTAPGEELAVGTATGPLNTLAIAALPDLDQKPVPHQSSAVARYFTPASALELTSNASNQTSSAFNLGENIAGFVTSFDFQLTGNMSPQSFGMLIQDQAQGALPLSATASGVNHSVGIFFNANPATPGGNSTGLAINGAAPNWIDMTQMNGAATGIVLSSASTLDQRAGDVYNVTLTYDNTTHLLTETVKDLTMNGRGFNTQFSTIYSIDIVGVLGMPAAYVGFVGASGLGTGEQDILNWSFIPGSSADVINGAGTADQITLRQDPDHQHIDWILNGATSPATTLLINDPAGLSINGNGGNDLITLDYSNGNPLPSTLHLNGTFTINGMQGTNPLAGTTLEIGRSTLFISYSGSDPIAAIQGYLKNGYENGAWNGSPTASTGVITSLLAQANSKHNTAIGYADSADGLGVNTTPNTIELSYTLIGDANLDANVNSADLQAVLSRFNLPGAWDRGDFNYDGNINSADLQALLSTFNTGLGSQTTPLAVGAAAAVTTPSGAVGAGSDRSTPLVPAIHATGPARPSAHPVHGTKASRKRR